jgi:cyclic pyranopterin phosphate synthase
VQKLNHFDSAGNAIMADISPKTITARYAVAKGIIKVKQNTLEVIKTGTAQKGDVLGVARIAGIMAAKKTPELIPLCHPLHFEQCSVDFFISENTDPEGIIEASCSIKLSGKTGAEMEALTGVSAALLTIYDMCKAIDRCMVISNIRLEEKSGGKSGHWKRNFEQVE